ncbi:MAG: tetratricopeptide repeat protein [Anaerolineales bacterium]
MPDPLRARWPHILIALILLVILSPTPTPKPLTDAIEGATMSLQSHDIPAALSYLGTIAEFEPALVNSYNFAVELAEGDRNYDWLRENLPRAEELTGAPSISSCTRWLLEFQTEPKKIALDYLTGSELNCPILLEEIEAYLVDQFDHADPEDVYPLIEMLIQIDENPELELRYALALAATEPELALPWIEKVDVPGNPQSHLLDSLVVIITSPETDSSIKSAQIGRKFAESNYWELARISFAKALDIEPEYTEARAYYGLSLDMSGKDGGKELERAIETAPESAMAHAFMGIHLKNNGELEEAREAFESAIELEPDNAGTIAELASIYERLGEIESAKSAYVLAAEIGDNDPVFWALLVDFSLTHELEVDTLGIPAARNAVVLGGGSPDDLAALGYAHLLDNDFVLAERILRYAIVKDPSLAAAYYYLGLLKNLQGDTQGSILSLKQAALLDPGGPYEDLANRTLEKLTP